MRFKLLCISVTRCPFLFPYLQEQNRDLIDWNLALKPYKNSLKRAVLLLACYFRSCMGAAGRK